MRRFLLLIFALAIGAAPAAAGDMFVVLGVGESVAVGDVTLGFDGVAQDSRCPAEAWCFWPGDAEAVLRAVRPGLDPLVFSLHTYYDWDHTADVAGLRVTLVGVAPSPRLNEPIDPADYRASLLVAPLQTLPDAPEGWGAVKALYR